MSNEKLLKSQVQIRAATEKDLGFIFNSWLKSYKSSAYSKFITNPVYYDMHHKVVESILKRSKVFVAVDPKDTDRIFGYICTEISADTHIVHYAYVKETFRKMGIFRLLIEELKLPKAFFHSHSTLLGSTVAGRLDNNAVYNPYLAFIGMKYD